MNEILAPKRYVNLIKQCSKRLWILNNSLFIDWLLCYVTMLFLLHALHNVEWHEKIMLVV
jgi:hypothetical protein